MSKSKHAPGGSKKGAVKIRHGYRWHYLYTTWLQMKKRCYNPNCKDFRWYGGKGVEVCDRWRHDAGTFIEDLLELLGDRPLGYTLDRVDPFLGYSPDNVRWASKAEQASNKRHHHTGEKQMELPISYKPL